MKFANALIEADRNLNILGHCQATVRNPSHGHLPPPLVPKRPLPSWIPGWTMDLEATPFMKNEVQNDIFSNRVYKASGHYPTAVHLHEYLQTLFLRGSTFYTV